MKKIFLTFTSIFILIIFFVYTFYSHKQIDLNDTSKFNAEYEQYFNTELYSTDVITLMNKASDYNEQNKVSKDTKGHYEENDEKSIKIKLHFKNVKKEYDMESIKNAGVENFIEVFNNSIFKISDYTYNQSTKKINKIIIDEIKFVNN